MPAPEIHPVLPAEVGPERPHRECRSFRIALHLEEPPVITWCEAHANHPGPGPSHDGPTPSLVAGQNQHAIGWKEVTQPTFLLDHSGDAPEELKMLLANVREDANPGLNDPHQR